MEVLPQRIAEGSISSSHNTNNDNNSLDRNLPTMSEVCDTPITNNHGGTNSPTQWIDTIAWWRPAVCGRNVVINIKVTIVRQTIKLNPLYTLSTMIIIFHDISGFVWTGAINWYLRDLVIVPLICRQSSALINLQQRETSHLHLRKKLCT